MLGQSGSLYARDGAGTIRVLRDCSGGAIPGWRTCEGTVVQEYGPEGDQKIFSKYGRNMAMVPIYPSGTEERLLLGQTFSAPMPAEVKSLRCDFMVLTDDTRSQFSSEFGLRLEADGVATVETPPQLVTESEFTTVLGLFDGWLGRETPRRTEWSSFGFTEEQVAPFRGKVCTLNVFAKGGAVATAVLFDGFRFGTVNVAAHKVEGTNPDPGRDVSRANQIYQQAGVAVRIVSFDQIKDPDRNGDGVLDGYSACAFPTGEELNMLSYSSPTTGDVDVFYVRRITGGGVLGQAFCFLFAGALEMIDSSPGSIIFPHELGHVLGLGHSGHCIEIGCIHRVVIFGDTGNLMYPVSGEERTKLNLGQTRKILQSAFISNN